MNLRLMQMLKLRGLYRAPAGDDGDAGGGGGGGADDAAAKAAAEKAAADKAAADKPAADKAAADAAAAAAAGDGGQKPTDAEAKLLKDVMKQKEAAKAAQAEVDRLKAEVKKFEGIDPEKVRALLAQQEEEERKKAEARGEYERLTAQMAERHKADRSALEQSVAAEKAEKEGLRKQIAEMTVGQAFTGSTMVRDELTLTPAKARVIYGSHFEYVDGAVVGFDKPAGASDRTKLVDAAGQPLAFEDALRKLVDADPDKDQLYRSKMKPGAGSSTANAGKGAAAAAAAAANKGTDSISKIAAGLKQRTLAK